MDRHLPGKQSLTRSTANDRLEPNGADAARTTKVCLAHSTDFVIGVDWQVQPYPFNRPFWAKMLNRLNSIALQARGSR